VVTNAEFQHQVLGEVVGKFCLDEG